MVYTLASTLSFLTTALGQTTSAGITASSSSGTAVSRRLQGHVTNALDGTAVPKVLVQINSRSVLTDPQGHFEFPDFTDSQAYVTLTKPGYSQSNSSSMGTPRQRIVNLDADLDLKIYPNAIITGTVTGRDGLPLTHLQVSLKRSVLDQNGWHVVPSGFAQTNLHGEYRFREPSGRYQLVLGYTPRLVDSPEAILPLQFPAPTTSSTSTYFEVQSGQEKRIDLRPRTGIAYPVSVTLDSTEAQRGVQFYAVTSGGEAFQVPAQVPGTTNGIQIALPVGTYTLHARLETRDASMQGSSRLTVTGRQSDGVVIHLEPAATIPVELAVDAATSQTPTSSATASSQTTNNQQPDLRQFNLQLHNLDNSGLPFTQDVMIRQNEQHGYEFRALPGRYRLQASGGGTWWIESATSGVTNLMSNDIAISSGGSGTPIRIVASNAQGMVSATIKLAPDSDAAYIYFLPVGPSLSQINPLTLPNTGATVATISTRLTPGSYLAVALDHRIEADLHDPEVRSRFSTAAKRVEISSSATANIDLEIAQEKTP